ncbi:FAD-binding oxidoreductase [Phaeobacter gallaeciensis]|uniref:NAD(P)/FAD-dependent oxidoreductase n=1 Tax=Phaeobacter gallaeciensis TaxID=60890 RepID=UPI00237F8F52|nr:FAD-binding oxidoreductase [Phaeobacter gallaeciensis]MDE4303296.1 FAD-binding oxidoreductase [Phaeobacter gallaeciensis]MDE4307688.1 FAD-binding oxidoreductase [Phaeobacter gallaeciensis]MDE4312146.1 FAD-binding oxidoreductase [Phaeobacter gallaeciensis]MDE4316349.1 FAD-binding oxidoreductase [Phaeobacter gallaeciensis]MDE4321080.1 FAD-binding oxidoreductase [Phaeobacter gallaeciensis]
MALNLLYSNDRKGQYPASWYNATATEHKPYDALRGDIRADVCIVGAGYTGLSAALHLAEAGMEVALLDAHRVGFGASGRNGGQLGSGQRMDQEDLESFMGEAEALKLWRLGEEAKDLVKSLIARHDIDCHLKPGVAWTGSSCSEVSHLHDYARHLQDWYGYDQIEVLNDDACLKLCPSPDYKGGFLDHGAGHLHPLNYALGLARAAEAAGAKIYEQSEALEITEGAEVTVRTAEGTVTADHLILACNGYLGGLNRQVAAKVMPINNFIVATEPLGDRANQVLTRDVAVADSKFVVNYFRLSHDKRLLFGGGESYGYRFPADIEAVVRKPMHQIFPHLSDVRVDYAWGGTLGITMKRMPYLARLAPNVLSASGYSGHGVGTATHAGQLMALAIQGQTEGFDTMARVPAPAFPGGPRMRSPLLALAMTWYALRDRLGI